MCNWWDSKCSTCKYHASDTDDWSYRKEEWCEKGHHNLKGFPFKNEPKCYVGSHWKELDKKYWDELEE